MAAGRWWGDSRSASSTFSAHSVALSRSPNNGHSAPGRAISPILEELSTELQGKVKIVKLNVDENPDIAMRYGVMSIPTLLLFDGGDIKKKIVGAKGKGALMQELDEFLATSR